MAAVVDKEKCSGCGACVDACPCDAIQLQGDFAVIDASKCEDCGVCVDECPTEAISLDA